MNRYILTVVVALFVLAALSTFLLQAQGSNTLVQDPEEQRGSTPFLFYLGDLGRKHNCFFTIEVAWYESGPTDRLDARWVERPSEKKDLQQELEYLRLNVPYLEYEVNENNPRIIHIIDSRLRYRDWYGLESVIKSIDYTGKAKDLPSAIGKLGIPVSSQMGLVIGGGEFQDRDTVVHVKGEGLKVRDALTNFVPLEGRDGRFLWIARTKPGKGEVAYIYYRWPGKMTKQ